MITKRVRQAAQAVGALILVMGAAAPAFADWQGLMTVQSSAANGKSMQGRVYGKANASRFDFAGAAQGQKQGKGQGQQMSTLVEHRAAKAWLLMHAQKMAVEIRFDPAQHGIGCESGDIVGCFKQKGYRKTGSETVGGHPCDIYEGDLAVQNDKKKVHQKAWYPTDLKEVPMLRVVSTAEDGKTTTIEFSGIKLGALPAAWFQPPADYKKTALPDMRGLAQALTPKPAAPKVQVPDAGAALKKALPKLPF